ncbi:hypothetical protein NB554_07025 [Vibrio alginolyticus]|nr:MULTISPECIES: hypothetical protein [Vibrio]HCE4628136.1 hypothetical protein [Vibrio parahaemolyticus]MCR9883600.1 hypothetical protein [Vibrio alginolyticus]MDW1671077.1 hypothetical protein [Vibrio sp. Vb2610]MDW1805073.1 hypothetical protein [Vibrio sp. Vb2628]ULF71834.1 hypothetical protein K6745_19010 [Vibrio alginolyticus]
MNTAEMTQTEQLIENNTSYATRVYFNKDERMTEAVKQAIKDTYNVDSIICDGNVLLTKKDAYQDSEFNNIFNCLRDEIEEIAISPIVDNITDASLIQSVFNESRKVFHMLNIVTELIEISFCVESDKFTYEFKDIDIIDSYSEDEQKRIHQHVRMLLNVAEQELDIAERKLDILFKVDAKSLLEAIRTNELNEAQVEECKALIVYHTIDAKHRNTFSERFAKLDKQHQSDLHELILAMCNL